MTEIFTPSAATSRWTWLTFQGADAPDFLHRLSTSHVRILAPGSGVRSCFLNAQGKIESAFWLWRLSADAFAFEIDAGSDESRAQALRGLIDRYTFAERQEFGAPQALKCVWVFGNAATTNEGELETQGEVRICDHGSREFGSRWQSVWGPAPAVDAWISKNTAAARAVSWEELTARRIAQLSPWWGSELTETAMPVEVGWTLAIAENKGCYPGQEVIEKIIALGSPPRRLVLLQGAGHAPEANSVARKAGQEVGKITSAQSTASGFQAIGLVRKTVAQEGAELEGSRIVRVLDPSPESSAR